ncbi:MAG: shikimate dehydrogenase [Bacteroidales bacterium]|nr:shikimate dehydrogenase [Bacteroidales bacterium]
MEKLKLFGLIGESLKHSFSERYFKQKFVKENLTTCDYRNFELDSVDEFPKLIQLFPELQAVNVTMPYKEKILKYIDVLDEQAEKIGSVNVVVIKRYDKKTVLKGYNTDAYGIEVTLLNTLKSSINNALVLGTGGAAKAVVYVLEKFGINYQLVSRKNNNSVKYLYQDLSNRVLNEHNLIINTTPLGMFPNVNSAPDIQYKYLGKEHILIDLIYNPSLTKFLKQGKEMGATVVNGQEMLTSQAEKSWEIFCSA